VLLNRAGLKRPGRGLLILKRIHASARFTRAETQSANSQAAGQNPGQFRRRIWWFVAAVVLCALSAAAYVWLSDPNKPKDALPGTGQSPTQQVVKNIPQTSGESPRDNRIALHSAAVEPAAGEAGGRSSFATCLSRPASTSWHNDGGSGHKFIAEEVTAGLASFDYDNDGNIDLYFVNGRPLKGTETKSNSRNHLYRNLGGFRFQDVTAAAGVDGGPGGYGWGPAQPITITTASRTSTSAITARISSITTTETARLATSRKSRRRPRA